MGVERNDEPGGGHQCPRSEVDGVAPDHPAQKEIEPLAGAPLRGTREEITNPGALWNSAVCGRQVGLQRTHRERLESRRHVRCGQVVARDEEPLDGPGLAQHPLQDEQQRHEIASADPAMHQRVDRGPVASRIERADERRRVRAHDGEQRFDGLEHAGDAAEGERGRAEADDLAIVRRGVAPDDVDRIGRGVGVVERAIEVLEPRFEFESTGPEADPGSRIPYPGRDPPTSGTA